MIKGTNVTFNDVAFNDNAASGGTHAQAMGGAVYLDSTSNTANHDGQKRVLKASATFNVTKDTTYAGNKVSGVDAYSDTYGSYAKTGGGFMYMDRGGEANFNVADGVTLKIGKDGERMRILTPSRARSVVAMRIMEKIPSIKRDLAPCLSMAV